ncbi:bifunctional glutamate N-acetyltransferase/amino-acid acetyltransferase ArgJ [Thermithiobacillus plumbiphilus]|uniref:Arginine biosynthesis bifunctional protein ArgJ n=1 Tax=Thermithiobacillus plumbiphilus TaxID=1729899 RepID=A0ABU9D5S2_9PROT
MAVGLQENSQLYPVPGVQLGVAAAGIKKPDRLDLTLLQLAPDTRLAAVFTRNRFCAAPVILARNHLRVSSPRALVINTGYANAGTGEPGIEDARAVCDGVARQLGCELEEVLPFSTGVIGERFPVERLLAGLSPCKADLKADNWLPAARAIMTTDTVAKGASRQIQVDGVTVTVTGICKGAGMIRPDMATMLAFIATDAPLCGPALEACLQTAVNQSFNRITVDGDTSTNDACVLIATGKADLPAMREPAGAAFSAVQQAVNEVTRELAQAIVRDGEGATKFISIEVEGGRDVSECLQVAYRIAHSPLVKTAFFASDPNWGRLLAAIGSAGIDDLDVSKVSICLDDLRIVQHGAKAPAYTEAAGAAVMARPEVGICVNLGRGNAAEMIWTCDFSYDYVKINAEYRT